MSESNFPRGAVTLPEINPDAHFVIDIAALEKFENAYGEDYILHVFERLEAMTLSVIKTVAECSIRNASVETLLSFLRIDEIAMRLSDALSLTIYGRTVADELEKRQADAIAAVEKMKAAREAAEAKNGKTED